MHTPGPWRSPRVEIGAYYTHQIETNAGHIASVALLATRATRSRSRHHGASWSRGAMNHSARLQTDLAAVQAALVAKVEMTQEFRIHLGGSKFSGIDPSGDATGSRRATRRAGDSRRQALLAVRRPRSNRTIRRHSEGRVRRRVPAGATPRKGRAGRQAAPLPGAPPADAEKGSWSESSSRRPRCAPRAKTAIGTTIRSPSCANSGKKDIRRRNRSPPWRLEERRRRQGAPPRSAEPGIPDHTDRLGNVIRTAATIVGTETGRHHAPQGMHAGGRDATRSNATLAASTRTKSTIPGRPQAVLLAVGRPRHRGVPVLRPHGPGRKTVLRGALPRRVHQGAFGAGGESRDRRAINQPSVLRSPNAAQHHRALNSVAGRGAPRRHRGDGPFIEYYKRSLIFEPVNGSALRADCAPTPSPRPRLER